MSFIKNFLSILLSVLLVLSISIFALALSANIFLYPAVYETALEKNNLYTLFENYTNQDSRFMFLDIEEKKPREIINSLLKNTLAYVRADTNVLNLTIKINNSALESFFEEQSSKFPECFRNQEPFIGEEIICKPKKMNASEFVKTALQRKNVTLPETGAINVAAELNSNGNIDKLRNFVHTYKLVLYGSAVLALILIIIILFFQKMKSSMRWLGTDFIFAGFAILSAGILLKNSLADFAAKESSMFKPLISDIFSSFFVRFQMIGISILICGFLLLILSFLLRKSKKIRFRKK